MSQEADQENAKVRADQWLWAVRLFKTRTLAATACRLNQVKVNKQDVKPSRLLRVGDEVRIERPDFVQSVKVLQLLGKRIGAKQVPEVLLDITPQEELAKAAERREQQRLNRVYFIPGQGRPTKRDRRVMEDFEKLGDENEDG